MDHIGACGICHDICELHEKLGCVCSSGVQETAKAKVFSSLHKTFKEPMR